MSKDTFYFSHDFNARNDRKIVALVHAYKAAGYGIYWAVCEMMHEEKDTLVYDDITIRAIAIGLNEEPEFIKEVIDKCVSEYKLFILEMLEDNILTSKRVKKNLSGREDRKTAKVEAGRLGGQKSGESRRNKQNESREAENEADEAVLHETNQRKGKERKGKENYNKGEIQKFSFKTHGLGEIEVGVLNSCEVWQLTEMKDFVTRSQQNFESIAMNNPLMNNSNNFKVVLQEFVNMIQSTSDYQEAPQLRKFFGNWVSKKNGTLESFINNIKNSKTGRKNMNEIL